MNNFQNPREDTVNFLTNLAFEHMLHLIKYGSKVCKTKKLTLDGCYCIALTNDKYFAKISSQLRHFEQVERVLSDFTLKGPPELEFEWFFVFVDDF